MMDSSIPTHNILQSTTAEPWHSLPFPRAQPSFCGIDASATVPIARGAEKYVSRVTATHHLCSRRKWATRCNGELILQLYSPGNNTYLFINFCLLFYNFVIITCCDDALLSCVVVSITKLFIIKMILDWCTVYRQRCRPVTSNSNEH